MEPKQGIDYQEILPGYGQKSVQSLHTCASHVDFGMALTQEIDGSQLSLHGAAKGNLQRNAVSNGRLQAGSSESGIAGKQSSLSSPVIRAQDSPGEHLDAISQGQPPGLTQPFSTFSSRKVSVRRGAEE